MNRWLQENKVVKSKCTLLCLLVARKSLLVSLLNEKTYETADVIHCGLADRVRSEEVLVSSSCDAFATTALFNSKFECLIRKAILSPVHCGWDDMLRRKGRGRRIGDEEEGWGGSETNSFSGMKRLKSMHTMIVWSLNTTNDRKTYHWSP